MSYNMSQQRDLPYVNWIVHAVFTEDVTGRMEVLKISTTTTTTKISKYDVV